MEEELLLVDERGVATPVAPSALADAPAGAADRLGAEIQQEMIETQTRPQLGTDELFADIVEGRSLADALARRHGARAVAVAMSPLPLRPHATPDPRYDQMMARYGLTVERLGRAAPGAAVLHPGPINRGVEITDEVADGPQSWVLRQVANGVAVRMAVLEHLLG